MINLTLKLINIQQSTFIHQRWLIFTSLMWETSTSNTKRWHTLSVIRQPNFGSLQVLSKELKTNAISVPLTLRGGIYNHLGLHITAICKISGRRIQVPNWSIHSCQKRYWSLDQSSMWGMEGVSLHIPSVPSCWKSTYCPSGSSGGPTLSGYLEEHKHNPIWGQHSENTTSSINNLMVTSLHNN